MKKIIKKLESSGSIVDVEYTTQTRSGPLETNIAAARKHLTILHTTNHTQ